MFIEALFTTKMCKQRKKVKKSTNGSMHKQNVVYKYNRILFSLSKG